MAEPRTREALAVRRDDLAADIMALMLSPQYPARAGLIDALYRDYAALADEIARRNEPAAQPRLEAM